MNAARCIGGQNKDVVSLEAGITLFYDNWRQLRRQLVTIIFFEQKYAALAFGNIVVLTVDLSTLERHVPPLSPLAHEARGAP